MAHQTSLMGWGVRPFYTCTSVEYVVTKTGDWDARMPHQTSLVSCGIRPFNTYNSYTCVVCKTGDWDERQPHLLEIIYKRCPS